MLLFFGGNTDKMRKLVVSQMLSLILMFGFCTTVESGANQSPISLNPGIVLIEAPSPPNVFSSPPVQVSVLSEQSDWSITCLAEPLVHELGDYVIPLDRIFIQHNYSGGEDIPMNTSVFLGNGGVTSGYEIINNVTIRVHVLEMDKAGTYHSLLRLKSDELGEAVLPVDVHVHESINFEVTPNIIHFNVSGPPGSYPCKEQVMLNFHGNTANWQLHTDVDPVIPQSGNITPQSFFVETGDSRDRSSGNDLSVTQTFLDGGSFGSQGSMNLYFALKTRWNTVPGTYTTRIHFSNQYAEQTAEPFTVAAVIQVQSYSTVELGESDVTIDVTGAPGEYTGTPDVRLNIQSNTTNWEVIAEILEDFESIHSKIPEDRFYIYSSYIPGKGFQPLSDKPVVAASTQMNGDEDNYLRFKVKTTIHDIAGIYKGKIRCILITLPD